MKSSILNLLLWLDNGVDKLKEMIIKNKKLIILSFISTFIIGLFAYCFIFLNSSYSHDGLNALEQMGDDNWKIALGRYLQPIFRKTRGFTNLTWLIGILSLLYLSCSSFIIYKIFDFKNKISLVLISGIITLNMSLSLTFMTYSHEADMFSFSILLATIAIYLFKKFKNGFLFGSIFIACSMGLYQAYLSIPICLIMLLTIKCLLQNNNFKDIITFVFKGIIMVLLGSLLYYIGLKLATNITGVALTEGYNSINNIKNIALKDIPKLIENVYTVFKEEIINVFSTTKSSTNLFYIINFILTLTCLFLLFNRKKWYNKFYYLLIFIIISLYPIFANISGILSNGMIHSLMTYSCYLILLFPILIYENTEIKIKKKNINIFKYLICFILVIMLYKNVIYSNNLALRKYFNDRATYSTMTRIIGDIEEIDEYTFNKTPIYFIGDLNSSQKFNKIDVLKQYSGIGFTNNFTVTYEATYKNFLLYNLAYPIIDISSAQVAVAIPNSNAFIYNMPTFPQKGYVQYKNGIILVRLS